MGDKFVQSPPGIHWAAYSDSALLASIKTIATEWQSRAAAREAASGGAVEATSSSKQLPALEGSVKPALEDEKKVEKPGLEWY